MRLGTLNNANLQALDKALSGFAAKKVNDLIVDLRASSATNDLSLAAEFAKRFCPKGKPIFTVRKPTGRQDRVFSSDREPAFRGLVMVLADSDTSGAAEAIAAALRFYNKALVIGQPTAGRAAEYSDLPLPNGKGLRLAVAEMVSPEGRSLFPEGVKPDLPVEMSLSEKRQIFQSSSEKGMGPFIYETGRPHMSEAALLAGTNPELEAAEAAQQRRGRAPEKPPPHDPVLQRALDVVTSLEVYQKRLSGRSRRFTFVCSASLSDSVRLTAVWFIQLTRSVRFAQNQRRDAARRTYRLQVSQLAFVGRSAHAPEPGARSAALSL